jgi:hypothetical protein
MKYAAADIPILSLFIAPLLIGLFSRTVRTAILLSVLWAVAASLFIVIWYGSFYPFEGSVGPGAKFDALMMSGPDLVSHWLMRLGIRVVFAGVYAALVFWCKEKVSGRAFSFTGGQKQAAGAMLAIACLLTGFEYYREQKAAEQRALIKRLTEDTARILRAQPQLPSPSPRK